jgi:GT2 family glycosyltransferase
MDEILFPVSFNDVDYCLRLRAIARRIVFTPHARLVHLESASRGKLNTADHTARFIRELSALRLRWGDVLLRDPLYNATLSLDHVPPIDTPVRAPVS